MKLQRQIIAHIPHKGMTRDEWAWCIERELMELWKSAMTAAEREALPYSEDGLLIVDQVPKSLYPKIDRIILEQAETLGWRIELAALVQYRKSDWDMDPKGPEMHKKFGLACAKFARIAQRKRLPPITDPDQWAVKQETVEELRVLLQNLRAKVAIGTKSSPEVLFSSTANESPETYPHVAANLELWQKFFHDHPHTLRPMAVGDRPKPAALYDEFLAASSGWEVGSLRQTISRLKP